MRYPAVPTTDRLRRWCSADPEVDAVLIATPICTHYPHRQGRARGRQARLRREADDGRRGAGAASWSSWPTHAGLTLMVGHTFVFSPPVRKVKEIIDSRRARRHLLHHHPAREPRPAPEGRQRGLGPRPARPLDPLLLARRGRRAASSSPGAAASCPSIPDVAFVNLRFPSGRRRRDRRSSWLSPGQAAPHDRRRQQEDARLRRHRERREGQDLRPRRGLPGARRLRRVPAHLPHRRHRLAQDRRAPSRCALEAEHFVRLRAQTGERPITDGWAGLRVVASLEAAQALAATPAASRRSSPAPIVRVRATR